MQPRPPVHTLLFPSFLKHCNLQMMPTPYDKACQADYIQYYTVECCFMTLTQVGTYVYLPVNGPPPKES
jgi:hypothetical protein